MCKRTKIHWHKCLLVYDFSSLVHDSTQNRKWAMNHVQNNFVAELAGLTYLGEAGKVEGVLD